MGGDVAAKQCGYCGLENGPEADTCNWCGKALASIHKEVASSDVPPLLQSEPPSALNGGFATLVFFSNVAAQIAASFLVGMFAFGSGLISPASHQNPEQAAEAQQKMFMLMALPSIVAGGAAVFVLAFSRVRPQLRDSSPTGAAWLVGSPRQIAAGFGIGVLVALGCALLGGLFGPNTDVEPGPLARMGMTPGLPQVIWLAGALLFAPIIEECLFRGLMYGGYRRSLGPVWAAVLSTFLFWALHLPETFAYWPAMLGILALALTALWYRIRCRAVGPAVALHTGYNAIMALGAVIATSAPP